MTSRERVLAALRGEEPDRVPYCELYIDRAFGERLMGWEPLPDYRPDFQITPFTADEEHAIADRLHLDNVFFVLRPPTCAETGVGDEGRPFYSQGLIRSMADLAKVEFPDPFDDATYAEAEAFAREKGDRAAWLVTRVGIFSTMLSIGLEAFSVALYEDRGFVEALLDRYIDWTVVVAKRVAELGFDVYASTDDIAFKTGPFFSPAMFREVVLPRYRRVAEAVSLPWVVHSDGNMLPLLDDFASLGVAGMHPNERGAMDIRVVKRDYGDRFCVLGNVDLDLLTRGTPAEVDAEVRGLIRDIAPGGGYILTSGNSLASYVEPANVVAMVEAARKYGQYPIHC